MNIRLKNKNEGILVTSSSQGMCQPTHVILSYQNLLSQSLNIKLSSESLTLLVDMVHHRDVRMGSSLSIPHFDHKCRVDCSDRNELTMSDLDMRKALETGVVLNSKGPADADDGEELVGSILNGLLHVLAEVMHLVALVPGPRVCPAFTTLCPTQMAENLVVEIMALRGLALATKNTFLTIRVDTIPRTLAPSLGPSYR